jgi:hypothetical protein
VPKSGAHIKRPAEQKGTSMVRKLLSTVSMMLATSVMVVGVSVAPASASPAHNGTDPYGTGCAANSFVYQSWPIVNGAGQTVSWARVRYSRTCGTNWITVDSNPAGGNASKLLASTITRSMKFPAYRRVIGNCRGLNPRRPVRKDRYLMVDLQAAVASTSTCHWSINPARTCPSTAVELDIALTRADTT